MPKRREGETIEQFAIRACWETGQFWSPDNPDGAQVAQEDLGKLKLNDPVVVKALISLAKTDPLKYVTSRLDAGETPDIVGDLNSGVQAIVLDESRCPIPDHAPPPGVVFAFDDEHLQRVVERMQTRQTEAAVGTGNWGKCHGIGNFHCAAVLCELSGLPAFLSTAFAQVLKNVQSAYAQVGLLFRFIGKDGKDLLTGDTFTGEPQIDLSFVPRSDGWIGLAIVGQGETCGTRIWCRFLATYRGGNSEQDIITQWTTLVKHELGHNCGRSHTSGGVMNPSIVNGLPVDWVPNDPSTSWLKQRFGGVPVPIPGTPTPPVPPPPVPPNTLETRVKALEIQNTIQQVTIDWLVRKVNK